MRFTKGDLQREIYKGTVTKWKLLMEILKGIHKMRQTKGDDLQMEILKRMNAKGDSPRECHNGDSQKDFFKERIKM